MRIYCPEVQHAVVNPAWPAWSADMAYNHDSDITRFKGRFYCAWNANPTNIHEGKPGQYNYLSTSDDFDHWSTPVKCFSSEAGADPPVDDDAQWQPNFINYYDEKLFCAWRGKLNGKTTHFISHTTDGEHWVNVPQAPAPPGLEHMCAFPTQKGCLTSKGVMLFPSSIVANPFWDTRFGGVIRSEDGGGTWHWAQPVEAVSLASLGENPEDYEGAEFVRLWEPVVYECPDGKLGLLVRHLAKATFPCKPQHMILYAESEDQGKTWSPKSSGKDLGGVGPGVMGPRFFAVDPGRCPQ